MTRLRARAFAKVNLTLKVLGRRLDGFHEIESVLQTVSLHDTLEFSVEREGIALQVSDPSIPAGPENLVWKAVERLRGRSASPPGIGIRLEKRIPSGAGLGGGSSDAAAALLAVDMLLGLHLATERLLDEAATLGSDVPYFLTGGTALITGRGTCVRALPDLPPVHLTIGYPRRPLSTREVYTQVQEPLTLAPGTASISRFESIPGDLESWVRFGNDLEPLALRLCPEMGRMAELIRASGARCAAMTGSGSAIFGVFSEARSARDAAGTLERAGFLAFPCMTVDRASFDRDRFER